MNKINKEIAVFIALLILILLAGLFLKMPVDTKTLVDTKTPVDVETQVQGEQVAGLLIEFEDGTTKPEVKAILEKYNTTMSNIGYNSDIQPKRYYLMVDTDKRMDLRDEMKKDENWTDPIYFNHDIKKGNRYVITVTEQAIQDQNFLSILKKNNLQVKNSVLCCITVGDVSKNWIWEKDAIRIENELKMNEKVLTVMSSGST